MLFHFTLFRFILLFSKLQERPKINHIYMYFSMLFIKLYKPGDELI